MWLNSASLFELLALVWECERILHSSEGAPFTPQTARKKFQAMKFNRTIEDELKAALERVKAELEVKQ